MQVSAYLNFNGQCEEAFRFYEKILGGSLQGVFRFAGTPMEKGAPPEWGEKIMHTSLAVGNSLIMGADVPPQHQQGAARGFSMCVEAASPEGAERVFEALAEGGTIRMPLQTTFWAARFGMLVDRFGTPWIVNGGGVQ